MFIEDRDTLEMHDNQHTSCTVLRGNDYVYKLNDTGREALGEVLVSTLLSCTDVSYQDFLSYEYGIITGRSFNGDVKEEACRSLDMNRNGFRFYTMRDFFLSNGYYNLDVLSMNAQDTHTVPEFVTQVEDVLRDDFHIDARKRFGVLAQLDYITGNWDRGFHNIGILTDGKHAKLAPIFDNGKALCCATGIDIKSYKQGMELCNGHLFQPFFEDSKKSFEFFLERDGLPFTIDRSLLEKKLDSLDKAVGKSRFAKFLKSRVDRVLRSYPEMDKAKLFDEYDLSDQYDIQKMKLMGPVFKDRPVMEKT